MKLDQRKCHVISGIYECLYKIVYAIVKKDSLVTDLENALRDQCGVDISLHKYIYVFVFHFKVGCLFLELP